MRPHRIAELLAPYLNHCHSEPGRSPVEEPASLSLAQLGDISTYINLLLHWNARINLTAIRTEEEIVTRHFGESFFAARQLFPRFSSMPASGPSVVRGFDVDSDPEHARQTIHAADLGSGAGFPGIPIKLWAPEIHMTLIESSHKKSAFLREVVRFLTLTNIDVQTVRAESLLQTYDVITLRAVERFTSILPIASHLTKPYGRIGLLIASSQLDAAMSSLPTFSWQRPIPIPDSESRLILIGSREPR